ncbi:MAG: ECF-type sigma factor [Dokdonella sp.]
MASIEAPVPPSPEGMSFDQVYERLRSMAQRERHRFAAGHTLNTTALVHEVYLDMCAAGDRGASPRDFFGYAARSMRNLLIDQARRCLRPKHGGDMHRTGLDSDALKGVQLDASTAMELVDGTALFGNNTSAELLHSPNNAQELVVAQSTIAGNTIGGAATFRGAVDFHATSFRNSIHWQPGKQVISVVSGTTDAADFEYLLSNDLAGIPVSTHNLVADPLFVDPATQDFHLQLASPAVDFLAPTGNQTADHLPRLRDLASVANEFGAQDLGAYERQFDCADDTVFCNGFE